MGESLEKDWFKENRKCIFTAIFVAGATIMGIYDVSGYVWFIFAAFLSAEGS